MHVRGAVARWLMHAAITLSLTLLATGCPSDPYAADTWIDKLDDPNEVERAVTELQRLRDQKAIPPLAKTWRKHNRDARVLKVIIELAEGHPGDPELKIKPIEPKWDAAVPVLMEAVAEFDIGDQKSIENATVAADALGKSGDPEAVQTLIDAANKKMPKLSPGQRVRLAAISALGKFGDNQRAVDALVKVLEADPEEQRIELFGAAANALADAQSPKAIVPLLKTMYAMPPLYQQTRRALIAIGKPAVAEVIKVFKNEHPELTALAKELKFNVNCGSGMGPDTSCIAPTNLEFKAATLLGDMQAREALDALHAELDKRGLPAFFDPNTGPGPTQHAAVLDALRKLNDPSSAAKVWAYAGKASDSSIKAMATDVYSFVARSPDDAAMKQLAASLGDTSGANFPLAVASGVAYGRLVTKEDQLAPIRAVVVKFDKAADEADAKAKPLVASFEKAQKDVAELRAKRANAGGAELAQLEAKIIEAQDVVNEREDSKRDPENQSLNLRASQREFQYMLARALVGIKCGSKTECYAQVLSYTPSDAAALLGKDAQDFKDWPKAHQDELRIAAQERALLELAKLGDKGRPAVDELLKVVGSTDRVVRQGAMMALIHTAELPCTKCVDTLDAIIKDQQEQSTLVALTTDTQAVRNYFLWAGK